MPRFRTLKDIDQAGLNLRLWCFACARGGMVDPIIWMRFEERGLPLDLEAVQRHFPCRGCGARDALILPATRPPSIGEPMANLIAGWFHGMRSAGKKRRR